ncbi:unnamed protein product [Caenorhabditis bovis]|uniref:Peptidase M13 N-terminal domain-containing protein n=1 Tax=Caenorhabditis bovis TaxID=2654633 RepID=A0A8S1EWS9_9PELO|nr:unnamed protein product [Caenorhabditis bovis]
MSYEPRRIASPVNRTHSFEIAISTSPPLSPYPDPDPVEPSRSPPPPPAHAPKRLYSPRRSVHETIIRELREYTTTRSGLAQPPISPPAAPAVAPLAEAETTCSDEASEPVHESSDFDNQEEEENVQERNVDELDAPSPPPAPCVPTETSQPIVFPITPFYRRKGGCPKFSICIGGLCATFFILSIIFLIFWLVSSSDFRSISSKIKNVCSSRECIDMAFRMSSNIEEKIEPCENFYQHSCHKFNTQTEDHQLNFLSQLKESSMTNMHGLLTNEENPAEMLKSTKLAKSLYESCMNAVQRSSNSPADLHNLIQNFPCGPILPQCHNFNSDSYSWERHSGMLDWYAGDYNLIVYGRDVHPQDRSKIILQIRPPNLEKMTGQILRNLLELAKPSSTEFEPLFQLSLRQNLLNDFVRFQLLQDPRSVQSDLDNVARLIVDLHAATRKSATITPNATYMTINELSQALPQLFFREFLDAYLSNIYKWTEEDLISIQDYEYFARLVDIMATTDRKTVANYLVIATTFNMEQYSYSPREQFGWRECVDQISRLDIASKLFIDKNANIIEIEKIFEFLTTLKTDFISTHRSTPLQYLSTINRLGFYVGYPKRLQNEDIVWRPVSQLSTNQSNYFDSIIRVSRAEREYSLSQIGTYLDIDDTTEFPVINPTMLYNSHVGAIVIPLSFLKPPIHQPDGDVPMYAVYSSLGITILQMISKVFWDGLDKSSQLQCLDNVYRGFLNGNRQRAANLDNQLFSTIELSDAFKTAIYSYTKWQNDRDIHREKSLPAFDNLDSVSSLMLTFSTLFCSNEGQEPGSDYEAMINTVAANSKMFTIHFNCNNTSRIFNRRTCL